MKIYVADHAGFCFGVERAIGLVEKTSISSSSVSTLGPIIHNPQVVDNFAKKGVSVKEDINKIKKNETVVIRSHGISNELYKMLSKKEIVVVDATCPFVKKAHESARKLSLEGYTVVVFGEKDHPEIEGIVSYIEGEYFIVTNIKEAEELPFREKYGFTAQTTQDDKIFHEIESIIRNKCKSIKIYNTICNATKLRQKATKDMAETVDLMLVVGGKNSANTTRLYNICKNICKKTFHIETKDELSVEYFKNIYNVGITAGASTPDYLIREVIDFIKEVDNARK